MRQLLLTTVTSVLGVGLMIGTASAATITCNGSISNTGANSTNTVNCVDTNKVSVTCDNQGVITESNNQSANSGSATTSGNTSGGNATSGSSSNTNTQTVQLGASCTPVSSSSSTTPSGGGKGAGTPFTTSAVVASTSPKSSSTATPTSLPGTGSNSALKVAEIGLTGIGGLALVSGVVLSFLKQRQLR